MDIKSILNKLLLVSLLIPIVTFADDKSFSNMFVFGDSLSDNGNLALLPDYNFLNSPPFNHGFTNGLFAVEVLAQNLGLTIQPSQYLIGMNEGTNYAVAGATAGSAGNPQTNLASQVGGVLGTPCQFSAG